MIRSLYTKIFMCALLLILSLCVEAQVLKLEKPKAYHPAPFTHPGLLHSSADLQRMRDMVARGIESWKSGYEKFRKSPYSSADWKPSAVAHVERSRLNGAGKNIGNLERDVCATYQNALMWAITGNEAHAEAVVEIINAWSDTFKTLYCQ